ncbi:MAG: hypothetical protein HZB71_01495 [Betaproteobacteria bacterium]|nr:hypothetical protein [Betaproteobacteria bacterium]
MKGLERWTSTAGTQQGAVISPLLANIYLHPLDERMAAKGYRMVRYADDFVVLCRTTDEAAQALAEVRAWVEGNGLTLHPDKTRLGDCREAGQGFDFLGYRFEAGKRWVRKKSLKALKDKLRSKTGRTNGTSLSRIIEEINPILKGWFGYFKHASRLDGFIRRRLRALLGEPCAGEPHARFGGRRGLASFSIPIKSGVFRGHPGVCCSACLRREAWSIALQPRRMRVSATDPASFSTISALPSPVRCAD